MTLSGNNSGIDDAGGVQTLTIGDQTIQGVGEIGRNSINVVNQIDGLIDANVDGETLTIDVANSATDSSFINEGTLRASGGGILEVSGAGTAGIVNTDGIIEALDGSEVQFTASALIIGGELNTTGSGQFFVGPSQVATLDALTLNGPLLGDDSTTVIAGTINNTSSIDLSWR